MQWFQKRLDAKISASRYLEEIQVSSIIFDFFYCQQRQEQVGESFPIFRVLCEAQMFRAANKFRVVLTHKPRIVIVVIRVALNFL